MKISIITATYNSQETLADTFDSVLKQTYQDFEYIVIDGKSTDGTIDIIKSYESKFGNKMRWISEPDRGIYDAMNKGIAMASGDVIGMLNSDDFYTTNDILADIADQLTDKNTDAVYGDVHFINSDGNKCVRYYSSARFKPSLLRFGFMPAHPSFYAKKQVYHDYGVYSLNYRIAADYDFFIRLFYKHSIKAKYMKKDFVTMRVGGMSTCNLKHRLITTKENVKACRDNGLYTNYALISLKYFVKVFEFKL